MALIWLEPVAAIALAWLHIGCAGWSTLLNDCGWRGPPISWSHLETGRVLTKRGTVAVTDHEPRGREARSLPRIDTPNRGRR
jgi:hypothetical protein